MDDKRHLVAKLVSPNKAGVGDYVFVLAGPGPSGLDIVRVTDVAPDGRLRVEGDERYYARARFLPASKARKERYLGGICPIVGAFTATAPLPRFPAGNRTSAHVVGRPELPISSLEVGRDEKGYLNVSFEVRNAGSATVALSEYEWDADANANPDAIPFALIGDRRYNVFRLRPQNKRLFPGASVGCWAKVSNWPGLGTMRLLVPSGMLGGAIGTFTMLAFDTPAAGADSGVRAAGSPLATAGGQRPAKRYLAFDIETAKVLPAGTEDLLQHRPLGIACAAAVAEDREEPLIWFGRGRSGGPAPRMSRDEAARLVMDLDSLARQAYTIVTWNGLGFDFNVLGEESGLTSECQKLAAAHVDMLFHTLCQLGHLVSLEKAAEGMHLPGKKPGVSGLLAPSLWAAGKHREVIDYCVQDVRLTLSVARTCERSHRFSWVTGRGGIGAFALNSGWLAVVDAERLPLPDTSWMSSPPSRSQFAGWLKSPGPR